MQQATQRSRQFMQDPRPATIVSLVRGAVDAGFPSCAATAATTGRRAAALGGVIACDQYTSQPAYWRQVEISVGDAPSTLRLNFPEAQPGQPDAPARITRIQQTMRRYPDGELLREHDSAVHVERRDAALELPHIVAPIDDAAGTVSELLERVVHAGPLPCKPFSMCEADEKRFYVDARRIREPPG